MICPVCGDNTKVTTTRKLGQVIKRYRRCLTCSNTFVTIESICTKEAKSHEDLHNSLCSDEC
jgi:transcriptional regulator NrdR family protein